MWPLIRLKSSGQLVRISRLGPASSSTRLVELAGSAISMGGTRPARLNRLADLAARSHGDGDDPNARRNQDAARRSAPCSRSSICIHRRRAQHRAGLLNHDAPARRIGDRADPVPTCRCSRPCNLQGRTRWVMLSGRLGEVAVATSEDSVMASPQSPRRRRLGTTAASSGAVDQKDLHGRTRASSLLQQRDAMRIVA